MCELCGVSTVRQTLQSPHSLSHLADNPPERSEWRAADVLFKSLVCVWFGQCHKKLVSSGDESIELSDDGETKPKEKRKRKRKKGEQTAEEKEKARKKRKKAFERRNIRYIVVDILKTLNLFFVVQSKLKILLTFFRKIISEDKLKEETMKAQEEEKERQRWLQVPKF